MAKLPEPPDPLTTPPETRLLAARTRLWRVYFQASQHPVAWADYRFFGPTKSRFDHHDPPPNSQAKGIFYGATNPTTCLAEVFQSTRVIDRQRDAPWLVGFDIQTDISLLDLTGAWPTRAGASMAINSGPRPKAQRWSKAIYSAYTVVHGLWYASSMHANEPAVALYERAQGAMPPAPCFHRALADPTLLPRLNKAARCLGYKLV
jgi:hypothetical protein